MSFIADKLASFGTTIFSEMTRLAIEHEAINLSQGFPDFDGPDEIIAAVAEALRGGHNQYARSQGHPLLVEAVARLQSERFGLEYDPMTEIAVTSGATEAIASSLIGILNPGDEVVLFEPFYDSYPAAVRMGGATPRFVTLRFPDFSIDAASLDAVITDRTRAIVVNTPYNPTGKVFDRDELGIIAAAAQKHDLIVISDEVYEHLTYDGVKHESIATLDGMRERTIRISSAGKSYSFTGWKVGWAMAPAPLIRAVQAAHQFVTFATATPMQVGLAKAMNTMSPDYYDELRNFYCKRRDFLVEALTSVGFDVAVPKGTYFVLADFSKIFDGDDRAFARHLIEEHGVAAIPPSVFYDVDPTAGQHLIRFAFCKKMDTLEAAVERIAKLSA